MWPATVWDDQDWDCGNVHARGWTVMGRVRERQCELIEARRQANRRISEAASHMHMMTPALIEQQYLDRLAANWRGSFTVLAFLFAMPDEPALRMLDRRGDYFDIRTGTTWDLFFPGYFKSDDQQLEAQTGSRRVGKRTARDWFFDPRAFDELRDRIESAAAGQWEFSGGADLVLVNAFIPDSGGPVVDWDSLQSGPLTAKGNSSLQSVIERISRDLEQGREDASYGVSTITKPPQSRDGDAAREMMIGATGEIVAAVAGKLFGLSS